MPAIVYVQRSDMLPKPDEMSIVDIGARVAILRDAGLNQQAETELSIALASEQYLIMKEWQLYAAHFPTVVELEEYVGSPPPLEAAIAIRDALNSELFYRVRIAISATGEAIAVGKSSADPDFELFLIAQWGDQLTTIEQLRASVAPAKPRRKWRRKP